VITLKNEKFLRVENDTNLSVKILKAACGGVARFLNARIASDGEPASEEWLVLPPT